MTFRKFGIEMRKRFEVKQSNGIHYVGVRLRCSNDVADGDEVA
jgi:hypothetical protein